MHKVKPVFHIIAGTTVYHNSVYEMLQSVGMTKDNAEDWLSANDPINQRCSPGEFLVEIAGRLCYKAFGVGLNPNITRVREGNKQYVGNILKQKHGSVLEHSSLSIAFIGVTRIFTHEIVRHRAGCAFSQESLRYVRLDDIGYRSPEVLYDPEVLHAIYTDLNLPDDELGELQWRRQTEAVIERAFEGAIATSEVAYRDLCKVFDIDGLKSFELKKLLTSAFRRIAPEGLTTNIMVTANHRAWRHMLEMRTGRGVVEEEMHEVMCGVGLALKNLFPNFYQDMEWEPAAEKWVFANSKI